MTPPARQSSFSTVKFCSLFIIIAIILFSFRHTFDIQENFHSNNDTSIISTQDELELGPTTIKLSISSLGDFTEGDGKNEQADSVPTNSDDK